MILVAFGFAIGQIVTKQLRDNYAADTAATAKRLAEGVRDIPQPTPAYIDPAALSTVINQVHDPVDLTLYSNQSRLMFHGAQAMGTPSDDGVTERGSR